MIRSINLDECKHLRNLNILRQGEEGLLEGIMRTEGEKDMTSTRLRDGMRTLKECSLERQPLTTWRTNTDHDRCTSRV